MFHLPVCLIRTFLHGPFWPKRMGTILSISYDPNTCKHGSKAVTMLQGLQAHGKDTYVTWTQLYSWGCSSCSTGRKSFFLLTKPYLHRSMMSGLSDNKMIQRLHCITFVAQLNSSWLPLDRLCQFDKAVPLGFHFHVWQTSKYCNEVVQTAHVVLLSSHSINTITVKSWYTIPAPFREFSDGDMLFLFEKYGSL